MSVGVVGQVIGREFRLERPLGAGGMGEVWLATHLGTRRPRALKLMNPALGLDARACQRFVEEARVGARIESEHVVEVVGVGLDPDTGLPWLAMELLEGEDLAHALTRGPLPIAALALLMEQAGHALGAAHAAGIVHRDLKPENLFLARPRRVGTDTMLKILDFGIAAILPDDRTQATVTSALGTPLWWSPEQMQVGEHVRASTDVWALGLIVFHALTGHYYWRTPYTENASIARIVTEILVDPLPAASVRARELGVPNLLPSGFDAWFSSCVARDPSARFRDARAAVAAFLPMARGPSPRAHAASVAFAATVSEPRVPVASGPVASGPVASGPVASGPVASGPVVVAPSVSAATQRAGASPAPPISAFAATEVQPAPPRRAVAFTLFGLAFVGLSLLGLALAFRLTRDVRPPPSLVRADVDAATVDAGVWRAADRLDPDRGESGVGESGAGESGVGESGVGESGAGESGAVESGAGESGHAARALVAHHAAPAEAPALAPVTPPPAPAPGSPFAPVPEASSPSPLPVPEERPLEVLRGSSTGSVGNASGGVAYDDACGSGEALVGLEGTSVPHIGRLRALCGRLSVVSGEVTVSGARGLPARGGAGEAASRAVCPSDQVVVGFESRAGLLVDRITLRCAALAIDGSGNITVGPGSSGRSVGGSGGNPQGLISCGAGEIARGARIRAGDSVDAFGLSCGAPR